MGFFEELKVNTMAKKAFRTHSLGMQLRNQGKYAESEAKLEEAIGQYDAAYKAGFRIAKQLTGYAMLLMRRGRFEEARDIMLVCGKDKTLSPDDRFGLRIDYSIAQWKLGRLDKAIETIDTAGGYKKNGTYYTTKGIYMVENARATGEFDEALEFMNVALDYDDEDEGTLDNFGQLYLFMSEANAAKGETALASEQRAQAKEYFRRAFEKKAKQVSSSYYYAKLLHEDGDDRTAAEVMDEIKDIPFSALLQITRAQADELIADIERTRA